MRNTFILANSITILVLFFLGLALFYYVVKAAVRNGVLQANEDLIESERTLERSVLEIKTGINKRENS
ncbi:MAG: hypothetical protein P4L49_04320 [Desulfosporosinus sp.]|nr:hypothetical protein [Desulfosporosinus sp.]